MRNQTSALLGATLLALFPAGLTAQSVADLSSRIVIDGVAREYTPVEAIFRNTEVCGALSVAPCPEEEPADDSAWSALQDIEQIFVTWDAARLVVAVSGRVAGHALVLLLDYRAGGMREMSNLSRWRRALRFGPDLRPDALVAVRDGARVPELFLVEREEALHPVEPERYAGVATFEADAPGRALEISIPWSLLFPDVPRSINPDSLAPRTPQFELPLDASQQGLRLAALVVHAQEGFSAADVAPDPSQRLPLEARSLVVVDRAARVDWDANFERPPLYVDFGAAVQTQVAARFVPAAPSAATAPFAIVGLETFRADAPSTRTRVLFPEADIDLGFAFRVSEPAPAAVYVSAHIYSMRGERVADLVRDELRSCVAQPAPHGCFGAAARDRWDGRDRNGRPVPGGMYLLRVTAGLRPGIELVRAQRTIAVVD